MGVKSGMLLGVVAMAVWAAAAGAAERADDMIVGVGFSRLAQELPSTKREAAARACAAEAAREAKEALGGVEPKLVLFFESWSNPKTQDLDPSMLDEIAKVFPREKVYGSSASGIMVGDEFGYMEAIGVLALGGDGVEVQVKTVAQSAYNEKGEAVPSKNYFTEMSKQEQEAFCQKHHDDGKKLAEAFGKVPDNSFLIMIGHLHYPMGDHAVKGVQSVLGERFPMIGSCTASSGGNALFAEGRLAPRTLMGIMVTTKRKIAIARGSSKKEPDEIAKSTGQTMQVALDGLGEAPSLMLGIECISRMYVATGSGKKEPEAWLAEVKNRTPPGAVRFIFSGSGEIGPEKPGEPARGVGHQCVSLCVGGKPGR